MAAQVTLTEPEVRAFSSLLVRVSERLADYEEQTHQDIRHAEELKAAADDLLGRLEQSAAGGGPGDAPAPRRGPHPPATPDSGRRFRIVCPEAARSRVGMVTAGRGRARMTRPVSSSLRPRGVP